jgi:hypothetical protein
VGVGKDVHGRDGRMILVEQGGPIITQFEILSTQKKQRELPFFCCGG